MLTYPMEERGSLPLYEYLCRRIRADILSGALPAGTRLPSKRALAEHLRVSVVTVEGAYSQLEAEGYLQAQPKRGFFVPVCFANTLLRLIAPRGQSLCAPQFRCAQLWPHAHNPALRRNSGSFLWFFLLLPKGRTTSREAAVPGLRQRHVDLILDGKAVDRQLCHRYGQPLGKCAAVEP